ncbi:pilus assembly protein PilM [Thermoanaerobacterium thermosaccharolyticum]|uniref:pilus assembly protein PilM n=1 Tax=Thermoanaerobacterium thermosaccharolyticum TaxID=1517 RepID=UPI0020A5DE1B|nr:pilus assembly protein PilM [Thermoanaerobacterium thermosaccharolyticum]MCP2239329.1 type IV pilus assembly protein PilM [Thermoanaerobacterium thermosaccharolyticum]
MIGFDIGSFYTKIGSFDKKNTKLNNRVIEKTPHNCIDNGYIKDINLLFQFLNEILKKNFPKEKKLFFCVSSTDIIIREIIMPMMKDDELKNALKYEIDQYIPNTDEYIVDYKQIDNDEDSKKTKVMIVAAPKDMISEYVKLTDMLKMRIEVIDVYSNCIYKSVNKLCKLKGSVSIVNIGAAYTDITLLNEGKYAFSRIVQFGGNDITEIIANMYNIDFNSAEEYKRTKPFLIDDEQYSDLKEHIKEHLNSKLNEISRIFDFFESSYHKSLNGIQLIGGTSKLIGLGKYIEEYFKIPVSASDDDLYTYFIPVLGSMIRGE